MKEDIKTAYSERIQNMLDKNGRISIKVDKLNNHMMEQINYLLFCTLKYYDMEIWLDYFSLLTRGIIYFAINSCELSQCSVKIVKKEKSMCIQVVSDEFVKIINKREFIEFINDLSTDMSVPDIFKDLLFLKYLFLIKRLNADNISYSADTIELLIPQDKLNEDGWNFLRNEILSSINNLPPLKENILKLEGMLNTGTYDMDSIADQVGTDPALTIDILKVVNSGAYLLGKKIDDIHSALKYLGLRELYNLLFTLSIEKTLNMSGLEMNNFWYHSYKCAYYSSFIKRELAIKIPRSESIYTAALLHDIGKFPISMIYDDNNDLLLDYRLHYDIDLNDIENALTGIRHGETGYIMAEKWKLPNTLKLIMKYHHDPYSAPEEIRTINDIVYMADCLVYSEDNQFNLATMDIRVLKRNMINSPGELKERFKYLSASFEADNLWK